MNLQKQGAIVALSAVLLLTGCQSADQTDIEASREETETVSEVEQSEPDFSAGFETSKAALNAYMTEIVAKDYDKAYEALHQIDKDTFSVESFEAYQKSMQLVKDMHGYGIHDTQTFWDFEFDGVTFEQVDFYDLDYAYVETDEPALPIDEGDGHDHEHDHGDVTDYQSHDHGHEMATMGVAAVKRNGDWFILQGLSAYELEDLTRKYQNQSLTLKMEQRPVYALGEAIPIGNMVVSVNQVKREENSDRYTLDVAFLNTGFEPLKMTYFTDKFAVVDAELNNYYSTPVHELGALSGSVRAGSYARGTLEIQTSETFETDTIYFMMNTIDPNREPIAIALNKENPFQIETLYEKMKRKPSVAMDVKAPMDGMMLSVKQVAITEDEALPQGWNQLNLEFEVSNLTDALVYMNQVGVSLRMGDGTTVDLSPYIHFEKMEGIVSETVDASVPVKIAESPLELTMSIFDTRPNNNVTIELEQ
jgi:hypothetical protein